MNGVRVLDLSHTLAGPFASMILADLGADVIKVEPPDGDETRQWAPFVDNVSVYYLSINRGKRSIVIDLSKKEGRDVVYRLVERSHVVLENYRPGVREKLGVDPDTLFRINRNLVYVSIKGFKPGSIYEKLPAYDLVIQALSGIMMTTGYEGEPPVRIPFALFDVYTGMMAVNYVLTGLINDKPFYAEVYLYDTAVFSMCYVSLIQLLTKRKLRRMGHEHPSIVPYQAFQDRDGKWFVVAAANDRLFAKLCETIGRLDLLNDPRFNTNPRRVENRGEIVRVLEETFRSKPREHWVELLRKNGVPSAPVYELDEVFQDPYVSEEIVYELKHPTLGSVKQLAQPGLIKGKRISSEKHQPILGEHTLEILKEIGYGDGEIKALVESKVVAPHSSADRR